MPIDPWEIVAMEFGPMAPYFQRRGLARDQQMMGEMLGMPQLGNVRNPDVAVGLLEALLGSYGPAESKYYKMDNQLVQIDPRGNPSVIYETPKPPETVTMFKDRGDGTFIERDVTKNRAPILENQGWQYGTRKGTFRQPKEPDKITMFRERDDGTFIEREVTPRMADALEKSGWQRGTRKGTPQAAEQMEDKQLVRTKRRIDIQEKAIENILSRYGVESGISVDPTTGAVNIRTSSKDLAFQEVKRIAEGSGPRARQARRDLQDLQEKYREIERLADEMLPQQSGQGGELPYDYEYDPELGTVRKVR